MQLAEKGDTQIGTQTYTANPGTTSQHVTSPSRRRRWILAVAAVATVAFAALALALWHGQSSAAPATNGPPLSSSPAARAGYHRTGAVPDRDRACGDGLNNRRCHLAARLASPGGLLVRSLHGLSRVGFGGPGRAAALCSNRRASGG